MPKISKTKNIKKNQLEKWPEFFCEKKNIREKVHKHTEIYRCFGFRHKRSVKNFFVSHKKWTQIEFDYSKMNEKKMR